MSRAENQNVQNDGKGRRYFHIILNMADDELDPYEYRLLGHYIRVGDCWESTRTTADKCRMSIGKTAQTRRELAQKGYIKITEPKNHDKGSGNTVLVQVVDRWADNMQRYAGGNSPPECSPDEQKPADCSPDEQGVHETNTQCSPGERKKNNKKNNQGRKESRAREANSDSRPMLYAHIGTNIADNQYSDGEPIDILVGSKFQQEYNALFYAYLDGLETAGVRPDTVVQDLWTSHRDAAVALAKAKRTPEQVADYLKYLYEAPTETDNWHQKNGVPVKLATVANKLPGWLQRQKNGQETGQDGPTGYAYKPFVPEPPPPEKSKEEKAEIERIRREFNEKMRQQKQERDT